MDPNRILTPPENDLPYIIMAIGEMNAEEMITVQLNPGSNSDEIASEIKEAYPYDSFGFEQYEKAAGLHLNIYIKQRK